MILAVNPNGLFLIRSPPNIDGSGKSYFISNHKWAAFLSTVGGKARLETGSHKNSVKLFGDPQDGFKIKHGNYFICAKANNNVVPITSGSNIDRCRWYFVKSGLEDPTVFKIKNKQFNKYMKADNYPVGEDGDHNIKLTVSDNSNLNAHKFRIMRYHDTEEKDYGYIFECKANTQCETGYECAESRQCVKICGDDSDCDNGYICVLSKCTQPCTTSSDCLPGEFCYWNYFCREGCESDDMCPSGSTCQENKKCA